MAVPIYIFMKVDFCFIITLAVLSQNIHAQEIFPEENRDNVWLLGSSPLNVGGNDVNKLDFSDNNSLVVASLNLNMSFWTTNASICDKFGQLLFFTNGIEVRNYLNDILATGLSPTMLSQDWEETGYALTQGAIILPQPLSDSIFYIFHEDREWAPNSFRTNTWVQNLYYSKIEMSSQNEDGEITAKNIPLIQDTLETGSITAVRHSNGRDWWLLIPEFDSNRYYTILFSSNGVAEIFVQQLGDSIASVSLSRGFEKSALSR